MQHIDSTMDKHGDQVMQAVVLILEGDHSIDVKEQVRLYLLILKVSIGADHSGCRILKQNLYLMFNLIDIHIIFCVHIDILLLKSLDIMEALTNIL